MNSQGPASFLFQVNIAPGGGAPTVTLVSESVPGQRMLRECLRDVVASLRFDGFEGDPVVLDVPILP